MLNWVPKMAEKTITGKPHANPKTETETADGMTATLVPMGHRRVAWLLSFVLVLSSWIWSCGTDRHPINNDDASISIIGLTFSSGTRSVPESAGAIAIKLRLSTPAPRDIIVRYEVAGTARSPEDHDLTEGQVTIPIGAVVVAIPITLIDDNIVEGTETIDLWITEADGVHFDPQTRHTLAVSDDDEPVRPVVSFHKPAQETDEVLAATLTVSVQLDRPAPTNVSVRIGRQSSAVTDLDYVVPTRGAFTFIGEGPILGDLAIAAGETSASFEVDILDDEYSEGSKELVLTLIRLLALGVDVEKTSTHTITVHDNEPVPTFQIFHADPVLSEGNPIIVYISSDIMVLNSPTFKVIASGDAKEGQDFVLAPNIVGYANGLGGGRSRYYTSFGRITDDEVPEADETLTLTLQSSSYGNIGKNRSVSIRIHDDDTPVAPLDDLVVEFRHPHERRLEANTAVDVSVVLSSRTPTEINIPFSVGGTTDASDHELKNGSLTIAAGERQGVIKIPLREDDQEEPDETLIVSLEHPTIGRLGAVTTYTLVVQDDDRSWVLFELKQDKAIEKVVPIGDFTGDGIPDFAMARHSAAPDFEHTIRVHSGYDFSIPWAARPGITTSPQPSLPPTGVAPAGDWNDDGYDDFVYCGRNVSPTGGGALYIVGGGGSDALGEILEPNVSEGGFSFWHCAASDFTGDGITDIVVADPSTDIPSENKTRVGEVRIYDGAALDSSPVVNWFGSENHARLGNGIDVLDYDQDGLSDVLAYYGAHSARVFSTATHRSIAGLTSARSGFHFNFLKIFVLGDWNGDSHNDLYVLDRLVESSTKHVHIQGVFASSTMEPLAKPIDATDITAVDDVVSCDVDGDEVDDLVIVGSTPNATSRKLAAVSGATRRSIFVFHEERENIVGSIACLGDITGDGAEEMAATFNTMGSTTQPGVLYVLTSRP